MSATGDYPLTEAPCDARKGLLSISMVLFSFTFFTGTMFAGGKLGLTFNFVDMLWIAAIGNSLLALYATALAFITSLGDLKTVLMGRLKRSRGQIAPFLFPYGHSRQSLAMPQTLIFNASCSGPVPDSY